MPLPRPPVVQTPSFKVDGTHGQGIQNGPVDAFRMPSRDGLKGRNAKLFDRLAPSVSGTDAFGVPTGKENIGAPKADTTQQSAGPDAFGMSPIGGSAKGGASTLNGKLYDRLAPASSGGSAVTSGKSENAGAKEGAASLDAFGVPKSGKSAASRLDQPVPKFTDSFTGDVETSTPVLTGVQTASPVAIRPIFETRFPSVEELEGTLISPISPEKPPLQAKASMMGNLTGDLAGTHLSAVRGGMPTARSTQVTGTAFKPLPDLMTGDGFQELSVQKAESSDEEEPESATANYPKQSALASRRAAFERAPSPTRRTSMLAVQPQKTSGNEPAPAPAAIETHVKPARIKPPIAPKPKPTERPEIKPKPHGAMPIVHGYSRSSSGRAFPISSSPAQIALPETPGSPEKRESVNSLIAKWNGK